jgi:hypothetical protein
MGGGKTTQTVAFLEEMTQQSIKFLKEMTQIEGVSNNFIWMTPNIALAENTFNRMKDFKSTNLYNTVKKKEQNKS